eukprot:TRINITY_DN5165_c0_g2_i1.p1 TRINITY_DN5165_c0_g2~~TRINITY_DN5165_c0_g2_i1.p1  ORF type:complete len:782 (+),score=150.26 TRINITY_DN5165_c0_g2_i1:49-2394(+)
MSVSLQTLMSRALSFGFASTRLLPRPPIGSVALSRPLLVSAASLSTVGRDARSQNNSDLQSAPSLEYKNFSMRIQEYIQGRNFDLVEDVLKEMKDQNLKPNLHIMNQILNVASQKGDASFAQEVVREIKRNGMIPNIHSYGCLVKVYCNNGDMPSARRVLDEMQKEGIQPNEVILNTLLNGYCLKMRRAEALEILSLMDDWQLKPTPFTITPLIRMEGALSNLSQVLKYWDLLKSVTPVPSAFSQAFFIESLIKCNRFDMALRAHYDLRSSKDVNNTSLGLSYFYLLTYCSQLEPKYKKQESDLGRISPSIYVRDLEDGTIEASLTPLYEGHEAACGLALSQRLFHDMSNDPKLSASYEPSSALTSLYLATLLKHSAKNQATTVVEEGYRILKDRYNIKDDAFAFSSRVAAYCKAGRIDQATLLVKQMEKEGISPDLSILNIILNGYAMESKPKYCWAIFQEMKGRKLPLDSFTITSMFRSYFKPKGIMAPLDEILQIDREMQEIGIEHSLITFNSMLIALRDNSHTEVAMEKFRYLLYESPLRPSERSYNTGLSIPLTDYKNAMYASEACMKLYQELKEKKDFKPTIVTVNTILKACALSRDNRRAEIVLSWIKDYNLTPSSRTLLRAVHTFVRVHQHEIAANVIKDMFQYFRRDDHKDPLFIDFTQMSYKFVLQGLCSQSLSSQAEDLHDHFLKQQQPISPGFYEGIAVASIKAGNVADALKFFLYGLQAKQLLPIPLYMEIREALSEGDRHKELKLLDDAMSASSSTSVFNANTLKRK